MVAFTINLSAQTKSTNDVKGMQKELAETLNSMIESAKPYYKQGDSYVDFKEELYGTSKIAPISKEGEAIIKKVYYYLQTNALSEVVLKDSGEVIANAILLSNVLNKSNNDSEDSLLFGETVSDSSLNSKRKKSFDGCCFFCFRCHVLWLFSN